MLHFMFTMVVILSSFSHILEAKCQTINSIPYTTREYWMRKANNALLELDSPCPFYAFGTVIVNHTLSGLGQLVCMGINQISETGNPILHGEIAAIENCSKILTAKDGIHRLTETEAYNAFSQLSLYTNAESCSMCSSAIRWAGFKEYIYGTSIDTLVQNGWKQIRITSESIFRAATDLPSSTTLIPSVLENETDPYFKWQFNSTYPCPQGCRRTPFATGCHT